METQEATVPLIEFVVAVVALIPLLWILQAHSTRFPGKVWFQTPALIVFALVAPLPIELFMQDALLYQMRIASVLLVCGLMLPAVVWVVRRETRFWVDHPRSSTSTPYSTARRSDPGYSDRRKRAGY